MIPFLTFNSLINFKYFSWCMVWGIDPFPPLCGFSVVIMQVLQVCLPHWLKMQASSNTKHLYAVRYNSGCSVLLICLFMWKCNNIFIMKSLLYVFVLAGLAALHCSSFSGISWCYSCLSFQMKFIVKSSRCKKKKKKSGFFPLFCCPLCLLF